VRKELGANLVRTAAMGVGHLNGDCSQCGTIRHQHGKYRT